MNCPICKASNTKIVFSKQNAYFTDGKTFLPNLDVALCLHCGFVFQSSAYLDSYNDAVNSVYQNYNMSSNFNFPRKDSKTLFSLDFICNNANLTKDWTVLEIGSDRGDFLYLLKQKSGANILGIELDTKQTPQVPTLNMLFDSKNFASKYNLVVLKHTLEHIKYPQEFLDDVYNVVADDGFLYIEVPSLDVCMSNFLDDFNPEHVSYFAKEIVISMCKNYELVAIDNSHFIRALFKKTSNNSKYTKQDMDFSKIESFFETLSLKMQNFNQMLIEYSKENCVVFYGVGLYFRIIFGALAKEINTKNCYFYDNNTDVESYFNLKKIDFNKVEKNIAVVFCSNDFAVQDAMQSNMDKILKEYIKIKPFRSKG